MSGYQPERQTDSFLQQKISDTQRRYTVTERDLLIIVQNRKEFRTILLGKRLRIHTDNKNLKYKHFNTDRVFKWRLILGDYGPDIEYIQGGKNIVVCAL